MSGAPDNKVNFADGNIRSVLPDGTILQFPKDTPPEVVDQQFRLALGQYMQSQPKKEAAPEVGTGRAAAIGGTQGLTFNYGDEIASGIAATIGLPGDQPPLPGDNWGERYDNALGRARNVQHAAQDQHPVAYGAGKFAGAVAPALVAPEMLGGSYVAAAPSLGAAALRGGATGAAYGAVSGFGEGEGGAGNRIISAGKGAAINGAAGALISPAVKGVADRAKGAPAAAPASAVAKDAGRAAYKAADEADVILSPEAMARLRDTVKGDLAEWGVDDVLQPGATRLVSKLDDLANGKDNVTLKGVEMLRKVANRVNNPQNASDAEAARKVIDHIDNFMEGLKPEDVVMGAADDAVKALKDARGNWSAGVKASLIEDAITKAQDRAGSTGTGGNVVNAIRQNLRQILDSPSKSRGFTKDEIDAIRQVVRGGKMENIARLASIFAPSRGGVNAWMATLATMVPGGQVLPVIGEGAHAAAQKMTGDAARALPGMILSRAPVAASLPSLPPYSEATARALGFSLPAAGTAASGYANALLKPPGQSQ